MKDWARNAVIFAALIMAALIGAFLFPADTLLGAPDSDMTSQFIAWRSFAMDNLRAGHLPLWNPFTYSGEPFLGGFQSALLYPLNWIAAPLPLARGINFSILLHAGILGWGLWRWARQRGLHELSAGLCAVVFPCSGVYLPHLYAGHLPNLLTLAWAPWVFATLERYHEKADRRDLLLASAFACLQLLAGHVQEFFYGAVAALVQAIVLTMLEPKLRRRALPGVAICYLISGVLAAAQILPGISAASEGVRAGKVDFSFVAMFSFPPENTLTLIAPWFFGELGLGGEHAYWGRWYLWETSIFVGVTTLLFVAIALANRDYRRRASRDLIIGGAVFILGLGEYTPLLRLLYTVVPGFSQFRGLCKFDFFAMLFFVLAAGAGAEAVIRGAPVKKALPMAFVVCGVALFFGGVALSSTPTAIDGLSKVVKHSHESYFPGEIRSDPKFLDLAGDQSGGSLFAAGIIMILGAGGLLACQRFPAGKWVPLTLLPLEMATFASHCLSTSTLENATLGIAREYLSNNPGNDRIYDAYRPNNGYLTGASNLWGNDPGLLRRYAEFMASSQGEDPDHATQYVEVRKMAPIYSMLRLRSAFVPGKNGAPRCVELPKPMDRLQLLTDYKIGGWRNAELSALLDSSFDPRQTVILEQKPEPEPARDAANSGSPGEARVVAETSDTLEIEADVTRPALLLVTDLYSQNWRAVSLAGSGQQSYDVLPANYILRATPMAAGHHRIRFEYAPRTWPLGLLISAVAWACWSCVFFGWFPRRR